MARKKIKKEDQSQIAINIDNAFDLPSDPEEIQDEAFLLANGWCFLKIKGDKKVFVKDCIRKQIDK
jgi:hypothetical protein